MLCIKTCYDYHIGNIFIFTKSFKIIHLVGNIQLLRIQTRLEKDPTFYSKEYHAQASGPLTNIAISWMCDFFSKHGEGMPDRETIHIPDNFSRQ